MSIPINAAKNGNCPSFDDLYERYHVAIKRRVKCYLVRDGDLVEDVCQETWIVVWRFLAKVPTAKDAQYAWLYRIATNQAINALRKKYHYWVNRKNKPLPPLSLDVCYDDECDLPLGEMLEDPRQIDPAKSDWVDIEQTLSRLTPRQRYLLRLRSQGYQFDEIQQIVGTGKRMTWLHVDRARVAFRHAYLEEEQEVA